MKGPSIASYETRATIIFLCLETAREWTHRTYETDQHDSVIMMQFTGMPHNNDKNQAKNSTIRMIPIFVAAQH